MSRPLGKFLEEEPLHPHQGKWRSLEGGTQFRAESEREQGELQKTGSPDGRQVAGEGCPKREKQKN